MDPDDKRQNKANQAFVSVCFVGFALIIISYFFYAYPWYYTQYAVMYSLNWLPDIVTDLGFFWVDEASKTIELMYNDLEYRRNDFSAYYFDNGIGERKQGQINHVVFNMLWPYIVLPMLYLVIKEIRRPRSPLAKPGEKEAMYKYAQAQKEIFPYIKPIVNIMKEMVEKEQSLDTKWYALPAIPLDLFSQWNILKEIKENTRKKLLTVRERQRFRIDKRKTHQVLKDNLGDPFLDLDSLPFNYQCVLAVVVPYLYGKTGESRLRNRRINDYYEVGAQRSKMKDKAMLKALKADIASFVNEYREDFRRPFFDATEFEDPYDPALDTLKGINIEEDLLKKGRDMVKDVLLRHAYVKTVIWGLYFRSWCYGVLSPSEMLWVKYIDRDLWFVISQSGRLSAFTEASGAWAHYLTEDTYGFRMIMPSVHEGIRGIDYWLWKTHDNYSALEQWEDPTKWDKLVPNLNKKGAVNGLQKGPGNVV